MREKVKRIRQKEKASLRKWKKNRKSNGGVRRAKKREKREGKKKVSIREDRESER